MSIILSQVVKNDPLASCDPQLITAAQRPLRHDFLAHPNRAGKVDITGNGLKRLPIQDREMVYPLCQLIVRVCNIEKELAFLSKCRYEGHAVIICGIRIFTNYLITNLPKSVNLVGRPPAMDLPTRCDGLASFNTVFIKAPLNDQWCL